MTAILEINDFELTLFRGADPLYHAPAIAIVQDKDLLFGESALRQYRLYPRQANQQYFSKLNAEPLSQPTKQAANQADLVYLHLKELKQLCSDDLLLAVPGNLSGDQLGVLLGICQEAGFVISGFVDSAVAAMAVNPAPANLIHLDIHLQHVVLTELTVADEVRRQKAEEVRDCGITNLVDGWANLITDRFVAETRFDPLHSAETEQQLYNQVFDWLNGAHHQPELQVVVANAGSERSVEVPVSDLEQKARQRYRRILEALPNSSHVAISARAARVPGLSRALKDAGHRVEPLASSAVGDGCQSNLASIVGGEGGLRLISALPHEHGAHAHEVDTSTSYVTHLLDGQHVATPIENVRTLSVFEQNGEQWLSANVDLSLNGESVDVATRLRSGDVISNGARSFTAIRVQD